MNDTPETPTKRVLCKICDQRSEYIIGSGVCKRCELPAETPTCAKFWAYGWSGLVGKSHARKMNREAVRGLKAIERRAKKAVKRLEAQNDL